MDANTTDSITNYKNIEFKLFDCASQIRDIYKDKGMIGEYGAELDGVLDRIRSRRFSIAVMGEFKRGKSTFINALLGARVLPADVTPTTATLNRITYGESPRVTICGKDGSEYDIQLTEIADYVTKLTEEGELRSSLIKEAVVAYPTVICQNHIDILDTPGLNDDETMTALSLDAARKVDAVILVISALSPFSELEAKFAAMLMAQDNIQNVFFVVSFIDRIDEAERAGFLENIKNRVSAQIKAEIASAFPEAAAKTERILKTMKPFEISSTLALDGIISGDDKKLKASRLEALKGELFRFLTSTQGAALVRKSRESILRHCENLKGLNLRDAERIGSRASWFVDAPRRLSGYTSNWREKFEKRAEAIRAFTPAVTQKINREKNERARAIMESLKSSVNPVVSLVHLVAETAAAINGSLHHELLGEFTAAASACLAGARAEERAILNEWADMASEFSDADTRLPPPFGGSFDIALLGRAPRFFWSARTAQSVADAPFAERPRLALRYLDEAFTEYVNGWTGFINDITDELEAYAAAEAEHLVPALLARDRETGIASAARGQLALKSMEKENKKINEIYATVNEIPAQF